MFMDTHYWMEHRTRALAAKFDQAEPLWSGKLIHANPTLQGHMFFRGSIGQEVDVLEEEAGPTLEYLTVRSCERTRGGMLGLYPVAWVQRQDDL